MTSKPNPITARAMAWLVSPAGRSALALAAESGESELVRLTARLRRTLDLDRTAAVLELVDLRRRAREKFRSGDQMFFTREALEQATDEVVAAYKARRFAPHGPVVDLGCAAGGDLLALARRGPVLGVELDRALALAAAANVTASGLDPAAAVVACTDGLELPWRAGLAWHADPDRRPDGRRTIHAERSSPSAVDLGRLLQRAPDAAIKLAPAASPSASWPDCEAEWISRDGSSRQLVAWFGALATPGVSRRATVLPKSLAALESGPAETPFGGVRTITGDPSSDWVDSVDRPGRYLYEPDSAVLNARLEHVLCADYDLAPFGPPHGYLTGDRPVDDPALAGFTVIDVLGYDERRVKAWLRDRHGGRLEVKLRGAGHDPADVRRRLRVPGDEAFTLLLARTGPGVTAVLARRGVAVNPPA